MCRNAYTETNSVTGASEKLQIQEYHQSPTAA